MKALKSLVVFSVMAGMGLTGCGGATGTETEDTLGSKEQATCPAPGPFDSTCTLIGPVSCFAGGHSYSYLCQLTDGRCKLYDDTTCTWSGTSGGNCATFETNFCG